jgi:hypothetical protein
MENTQSAKETTFTILNNPIENIKEFKYLGRVVTNNDNDTKALDQNIKKANGAWGRLRKVLEKGKMKNPRAATSIYKVVIQAILLYGSETWSVTPPMLTKLENFHRRCARHITGQHIRPREDGTWEYPHTKEIFEQTGLESMESYIMKRQENVKAYLHPESIAQQNLLSNKEIEISMNEVIWWKDPDTSIHINNLYLEPESLDAP